jgi:hypothetical protein
MTSYISEIGLENKKLKTLSLFVLVLILILPVSAQEDAPPQEITTSHPIEDVLRHIPSTASTRDNLLSYIDVQATRRALTWIDEAEAYTHESFLSAYPNGFQFANRWGFIPNELADIPFAINPASQTPSLDIFQIGQLASFGFMEDTGTIVRGQLDVDSLLATYRELDAYQIEEAGNTTFIRNRAEILPNQHPQNFFDPMMRRAIPLVVQTNDDLSLVGGALSESFYDALITTFEHSDSSIWHEPYYQLTARALVDWETTHEAQLIQALWIPQATLIKSSVNFRDPADVQTLPHFLQSTDPQDIVPSWAFGYRELTDFELPVLIADLQLDEQQVFLLVVPYDHVGNAEFNAQSLAERLQTYNNQARMTSNVPFVERFNGTITHSIYADENGEQGVAVVAMFYNAPPLEADGNPIYQGDVYNSIYTSINEGLFYPLWDVTLP